MDDLTALGKFKKHWIIFVQYLETCILNVGIPQPCGRNSSLFKGKQKSFCVILGCLFSKLKISGASSRWGGGGWQLLSPDELLPLLYCHTGSCTTLLARATGLSTSDPWVPPAIAQTAPSLVGPSFQHTHVLLLETGKSRPPLATT